MILRRGRDWIRVISPADYLLAAVLALAIALMAWGMIGEELGCRTAWEISLGWLQLLVCIGLAAYVAIRIMYFHPVENRAYGNWLATTPWRYPQKMPLGPLDLVWQDAAVIAAFTAICTTVYFPLLTVPIAFMILYCLFHSLSLCRLGIYWTVYVNLFLIGCMILAFPSARTMFAITVLMYVATRFGIGRMLEIFPFEPGEQAIYFQPASERLSQLSLTSGWPLPPARRELRSWSISPLNSLLLGVTSGWLMFCIGFCLKCAIGSPLGDEICNSGMQQAVPAIVFAAVVSRIVLYTIGFPPPISIFGRIVTRRLIIPGYDKVLAAPLGVAVLAGLMALAADYSGIAAIAAAPIIAGISVWLTLALPPRREDWQLTGHHRIAYRFLAAMLDSNSRKRRT